MAVGKRLRFEVFKRDGFACQYCGLTPPNVILQIDHIEPKSRGGSDDKGNLLTACQDCNYGKSNNLLSDRSPPLVSHFEAVAEAESQIKGYEKLLADRRKRLDAKVLSISRHWSTLWDDEITWTPRFKKISLRKFCDNFSSDELIEWMNKAVRKCATDPERATKYFCGICWNQLRQQEAEPEPEPEPKPVETPVEEPEEPRGIVGRIINSNNKPSVEDVRLYCQERGNSIDPEAFIDFYDSKGWKVGKAGMKDWKAAVRTWERTEKDRAKPSSGNRFMSRAERGDAAVAGFLADREAASARKNEIDGEIVQKRIAE